MSKIRLAVAGVITALALTACGGHHPPAAATTPPAAAPAAVAPSPSMSELESQWVAGSTFTASVKTVEADLNATTADATAGNITGLAADCTSLENDAATALSNLEADPNPDPVAEDDITTGLSQFVSAGGDCVAGAEDYNSAMISQATAMLTEGTASIQAATAQLNTDDGS